MENWKAVQGYEGFYEVSDLGRVRSKKRATTRGGILKQTLDKGYLVVSLSKNGERRKMRVHRLVANAFVDGWAEDQNIINHKNEIKTDNRAINLEWCDDKYNLTYNGVNYRRAASRKIPVVATKNGETISFESIAEAAEKLGVSHCNISAIVRGYYGRKTLKGYTFALLKEGKQ